jgi:hypothetical protein
MKKIIILTFASLFAFNNVNSQSDAKNETSKAMHKGVNSVNLYYGVSIFSGIYKAAAAADAIDLKFKTVGPVGIVYEHMVTDIVGLGAEFGYTQFTMNYTEPGNNSQTGLVENWIVQWQFTTIRAMFRANFHFANSENFDAYGLISAGYRNTTFKFNTNDPFYNANVTFRGGIPFGVKPGIGLRYFFTNNIGLNMEIAMGTPIMCGGLSFKF